MRDRPEPWGGRAGGVSVLLFLWLAAAADRVAGDEGQEGKIEVHPERGEARVPAWFVNPDRRLEVFACHESGPTHETVVAFKARGEEIYSALRSVGFRGPEFWNATSPLNLKLTGGDRALVWIRWEWKGKVHEAPAEEVLTEEATELPLFVRGFSFAAGSDAPGTPSGGRLPVAVELTIGGQTRQSAAFSMLYHPNDLPVLVNWAPAPEVSTRAIPELKELVEARAPCTLIIRRFRSEAELIDTCLRREEDPERRAVREGQRLLAGAIDGKKLEFETLVGEVKALLEEGEKRTGLKDEDRRRFGARIEGLVARGGRIAAEVRELYLRLWDLEEAHRLARASRSAHLSPDEKAWVAMAYRSGFRFEVRIAAKLREIAALSEKGPEKGPEKVPAKVPARGSSQSGVQEEKALRAEIEALKAERERRWARFKLLQEVRPRLKELDPREDPFMVQLFRESELRALADMRALRARAEEAQIEAAELRAAATGSLPRLADEIARRRARVAARARLARAELEEVELLEKVRWARNPPGGAEEGNVDEEEVRRHEEALASLRKRMVELRAALKAPGGLSESPEAPPDDIPVDPDGLGLYPPE